MADGAKKKDSHWCWFDGHKNTKRSPWLQSTIEELDARTKAMLRIIEEDADSFAKRAEMLYNKKPELIKMVEDFYKAHRVLAERYDLAKTEPLTCRKDFMVTRNAEVVACDTYSISSISEDYIDSEIDESEQQHLTNVTQAENQKDDSNVEIEKLKSEIEKLKEENKNQKIELVQKDEEKREVIRQLSMTISMLKEDNANLRQTFVSASKHPRFNRSSKPHGI